MARRCVKESAVNGSSDHCASASRNSGSTRSIVLMDGSRVRLSPSKTIGQSLFGDKSARLLARQSDGTSEDLRADEDEDGVSIAIVRVKG